MRVATIVLVSDLKVVSCMGSTIHVISSVYTVEFLSCVDKRNMFVHCYRKLSHTVQHLGVSGRHLGLGYT